MKRFLATVAFLAVFSATFVSADGRWGISHTTDNTLGLSYYEENFHGSLFTKYTSTNPWNNQMDWGLRGAIREAISSDLTMFYGAGFAIVTGDTGAAEYKNSWDIKITLGVEKELGDNFVADFRWDPIEWMQRETSTANSKTTTVRVGTAQVGFTYFLN